MAPATLTHSILVVDDDPDIALGLQDLLDHDGYQVNVAMTFDPPWGMEMMSDEARLELGFM